MFDKAFSKPAIFVQETWNADLLCNEKTWPMQPGQGPLEDSAIDMDPPSFAFANT